MMQCQNLYKSSSKQTIQTICILIHMIPFNFVLIIKKSDALHEHILHKIGVLFGLNSKRLCLQQIYGEGKYKDCNDLPIGESAIAFSSALNKPDANMYFIFCIGSMRDKIKIQYAMRYALVWNVRIRIYDFNDGTWSNWH